MTAHVAYPALDPSGLPATLSAPDSRAAPERARVRRHHRHRCADHGGRAQRAERGRGGGARARCRRGRAALPGRRRPGVRTRCATPRAPARSRPTASPTRSDATTPRSRGRTRRRAASPPGRTQSAAHLADALIDRGLDPRRRAWAQGADRAHRGGRRSGRPIPAELRATIWPRWLGDRGLLGSGGVARGSGLRRAARVEGQGRARSPRCGSCLPARPRAPI